MEIAVVVFILAMIAIAYGAFRVLKKTLKMVFRAIVILLILGIVIVGSMAIWNMNLATSIKSLTDKKIEYLTNASQNNTLL